MSTVHLFGFGNSDAGNDTAGRLVARAMLNNPAVCVHEMRAVPIDLYQEWQADDCVLLCDAVLLDQAPGTLLLIDLLRDQLPPQTAPGSTHGMGLAEAVALARALQRLPRHCFFYGIVAGAQHHSNKMDPAIAAAVDDCATTINADIKTLLQEQSHA